VPKRFDLAEYLRESTAKSGVPEKVTDPDVMREAVRILLAMRARRTTEEEPRPSSNH
jgi:hypothetical protein